MIRALLFARLREQAGTSCELVGDDLRTVADVYRAVLGRHPALESNMATIRPARNEQFVDWEDEVCDGDEVAFIPPVSGGADGTELAALTTERLDARQTEAAVSHPGAGALVTFTGVVRDNNRGEDVTHLEYEADDGMAEREMRRIGDEMAQGWPGTRA